MAAKNAAKRLRLFDLFVNQPGHTDLTEGKYFACPLCRRRFTREDCVGKTPKLTLDHIIPRSQGGTLRTLCCAVCNNVNGADIEKDMLTQQQISDWIYGRGTILVHFGEGSRIKAEMSRNPADNSMHIKVVTPMQSPAVRDHYNKLKSIQFGDVLSITTPWFRNGWCKATICQSAYLLMFRLFGYDFARCSTYNSLLNQVRDPNKDHKDVMTCNIPSDVAAELLDDRQAGVFFVSEPEVCILAVMRFISPGQADMFQSVVMPGPESAALTSFNLKGMRYSPVEDNIEVNGCWGASFGDEWLHWLEASKAI